MKQTTNLISFSHIQHGFYTATDSDTDKDPILMTQVHSADALFITEKPLVPPQVDALITTTPNLNLTVKTADCAPILLFDPVSGMIAAVHAGWRGAVQGVIETTILKMIHHGAHPDSIVAAVGPHIQEKSFPVGPELKSLLPATEHIFLTEQNNQLYFDFEGYIRHRLTRAGVTDIATIGDDTFSDTTYFSYRRDPNNPGRQFSSIMIKGD